MVDSIMPSKTSRQFAKQRFAISEASGGAAPREKLVGFFERSAQEEQQAEAASSRPAAAMRHPHRVIWLCDRDAT